MIKTLALVLKKQNFGETDRLLTIFTPVLGKKRVIVPAVRKPLSKLAGHLDTFMVSQVMLTERSELPRLTGAILIESFENLRQSLPGIDQASRIVRIIDRVSLEDVPQQAIFQMSLDALTRIDRGDTWSMVWLSFLFQLLDELGLAPKNLSCQRCGKPLKEDCWWLVEEKQFFCQTCLVQSGQRLKVEENTIKLLYLLNCKSYSIIGSLKVTPGVARQVEEILLREVTQWFNKPWQEYASLA